MYSTCLFCNRDLGRNEVVEHFPVGRRLAYDAAKGRLWVVCRACERWNLTPLEERWEAIEECERLFSATRLRASTDNVGLARVAGGLDLVRIGAPQRPEFAAWRYGDQFGRRRLRQGLLVGGGIVAIGGLVAGGAVAGVAVGGFGWMFANGARVLINGNPETVVARVPTAEHGLLHVRRRHLRETSVARNEDGALALWLRAKNHDPVLLAGREAAHAAALVLPSVNRFGGSRDDVQDAVRTIEAANDPAGYLGALARRAHGPPPLPVVSRGRRRWKPQPPSTPSTGLFALDKVERLALEMAVHEEQERRAMDGELSELARAWKSAEEIAAIADTLLLPEGVEERARALDER